MAPKRLSFTAQVNDFVRQSEERMLAVFRQSAQDVVDEMQKVGPSVASTKAAIAAGLGTTGKGKNKKQKFGPVQSQGAGGNMPVDTGFLRASLRISKQGPSPLDRKGADAQVAYDPGVVELAIATAEIGDTLYATYTAVYAARINYGFSGQDKLGRTYNQRGYHFVDLAAQKWEQIVAVNVGKLTAMSQQE